ncbi:MAG: hypothetical protein WCS77_01590 [Elusimicrobiaceae bacterium]
MKSLFRAALAVFLLSGSQLWAWWGYSLNAGASHPDNSDMKTELAGRLANNAPSAGSTYQDAGFGDLTFFMETNAETRLGFSLGYGLIAQSGLRENFTKNTPADSSLKIDNRTAYFPLTVYAKYKPENKPFSLWFGAGADWIMAATDVVSASPGLQAVDNTFTASVIAPTLSGGAEWFFTKRLALGLNGKYVFGGRVKDLTSEMQQGNYRMVMAGDTVAFRPEGAALGAGERSYEYDYSGFRVSAQLRVYFGGPDWKE